MRSAFTRGLLAAIAATILAGAVSAGAADAYVSRVGVQVTDPGTPAVFPWAVRRTVFSTTNECIEGFHYDSATAQYGPLDGTGAIIPTSPLDGLGSCYDPHTTLAINGVIFRYANAPPNLGPRTVLFGAIDRTGVSNIRFTTPEAGAIPVHRGAYGTFMAVSTVLTAGTGAQLIWTRGGTDHTITF